MKFSKSILPICALLALGTSAFAQGGVFITGHDPDFHAYQGSNFIGARDIINRSLDFVTNNHVTNVLLVTDLSQPVGGYSDPRSGLTAAGVTYDVADYGSNTVGVKNLTTVKFSNYSAVVVASDFGGWLRQSELNVLNARSSDLLSYINGGGGLVAFAESAGGAGLTTGGDFGFLPFVTASNVLNQSESGFTVSPFGTSIGLTNSDVNGNASHNDFTALGGLNPVDYDAQGNIISAAYYGKIGNAGTLPTPEPGSFAVLALGAAALAGLVIQRKRQTA